MSVTGTAREIAAVEVPEDLDKPYEQLLKDIYEEILKPQKEHESNIKHGFKRSVALFAKMGRVWITLGAWRDDEARIDSV